MGGFFGPKKNGRFQYWRGNLGIAINDGERRGKFVNKGIACDELGVGLGIRVCARCDLGALLQILVNIFFSLLIICR